MTIKNAALLAASSLALGLVACGDPDPIEEDDEAEMAAIPVADFDPMSRDYTLSEEAQTRRDEMDQEAFEAEYAGYRGEIMKETGDGNVAEGGGDMTTTNGESNTMTSEGMADSDPEGGDMAMTGARDPNTNMMKRSEMDWAYLDRNDDGKLSAAEYAVWAITIDPTQPLPDDETAPYLTADQINSAADSFFYYDTDGDTHLSASEFAAARQGMDL